MIVVVQTVKRRVHGRACTVVLVTLHDAVGDAQREGRIGRNGRSVHAEAGAAQRRGQLALLCGQARKPSLIRAEALQESGDHPDGGIGHGERAQRLDRTRGVSERRLRNDGLRGLFRRTSA